MMADKQGKRIVMLGGGGFGTFARDLCLFCGHEPFGVLDNYKRKGESVNGCPVLGPVDLVQDAALRESCEFVVAISDFKLRREWAQLVRSAGGRLANLLHPNIVVSPSARLGEGVMVNAFSFIYANAHVGDLTLIESHCVIGTEVVVGEACMIAPGVHINRGARIGEDTFVGSGGMVAPNVTIGRGCAIGAAAAVFRDVPEGKIAVGVPAKVARERPPGWSPR